MDVLKISNYNWIINLGIIEFDDNCKSISSEAKKNFWLPDNLSQSCFSCETKFSLILNRQHHCRICGNIFCSNCTNKQILFSATDKNGSLKDIKIKVCDYCLKVSILFDNYIKKNFTRSMNKFEYFCKYVEKSKNNNQKFLEINDWEKENELKKNIVNTYDIIIQNMVKSVLKEYFDENTVTEWKNVVYKIIIGVINNFRSSYLLLDDSLDINKYIKIKQIEYKDNSLSEVIPGIVIKVDQIKEYEKVRFKNPNLLLINLESNSIVKKLNNNFADSFKRNNGYVNILFQKIYHYNPDVILIGKIYPKVFQKDLNNKISMKDRCIIFDIKKKHLEQIARTTCNNILPSFNLIGNKNTFGKCKKFYIKNMKSNSLLVFEGYSPMLFNSIILSGKNNFFLKKMKMILKNILIPTARDLFCQKYLIYAFNMNINNNINSEYIYNMFEKNKKYIPNQINQNNIYTSFDITMDKINNNLYNNFHLRKNKSNEKRENILKNKYKQIIDYKQNNNNKNSKNNLSSYNINTNNNKLTDINGCFYNGFDTALICQKKEYLNYCLLKYSKIINENKNNNINEETNQILNEDNAKNIEETVSLDEKEIQKHYTKCKENPKKIFFSFFSPNKFHDKSIFQYFYELFRYSKKLCKNCNEPFNKHLTQYYKSNGKIVIKFITDKEYDLDKIMKFINTKGYFKPENVALLFNLYTYGYCNICKNIVTPLFKLDNEILNYSSAKLFRMILENINMKNNFRNYKYNIKDISENNKICNHLINKNISRIFVTEFGSCVLDYNSLTKYFIDPININVEMESNSNIDINNNLNLNDATYNLNNNDNFILIEQLSIEAYNNSKIVLEILSELFNAQIKIAQNLLTKEKLKMFKENTASLVNVIVLAIKLIENFKSKIFKFMTKEYIENNKDLYILKYIIIIKIIYIKIIQVKYFANIIMKYINKINIISDILYSKIPYSYKENAKLPNKIEIPMEFQKLENKKEYLKIISFIEYYDNRHHFFDVEIFKDDFCNIIANALASDDYINFIDKNNNEENFEEIKFSDIKCKRIINSNLNEDEIKKNISDKKNNILYLDINDLFESSHKSYNINSDININNIKHSNINTKIIENSSLIFSLEKNRFSLNKEDDLKNKPFKLTDDENQKILKFLKNQLLSESKEEFNFTLVNDLSALLKNYYINNSSILSGEKSKRKSVVDEVNDYFKEDVEEDEKSEKKENSEESKNINLNEAINEEMNELNRDMTDIKKKLDEFDKAFIDNQRQLNNVIKNSITEQKQNNLSRESSSSNLFKGMNRSRKNSTSSRGSIGSNDSKGSKNSKNSRNSIIEYDYKEYGSKSFKLDSNSLSKLNEAQNNDIDNINNLPKFRHMPDFLKIFELKKIISLEDKIISKNYPEYEIKVYYPRQFQALRTLYCSENFENFIFSSKQSEEWEISGGKSKANFFRSLDEKFAIKNISELEFNMLIDSAFNYFKHLSEFFFEKKPSLLAKILGAFHIKVKQAKEKEKNYYLIYMENIYYNKISKNNFFNFNTPELNLKVYDLKGSEINRYIKPKEKKKGKILLDTNFLEDNDGEPLFFDIDNYQILNQALLNDCKFLKKESIIDYSLLIIYEINDIKEKYENKFEIKKIRMGIIDYLRKYTWDKQIESYGKKLFHGFAKPTIINPEQYSERFIEKIKKYFSCV